MPLEIIPLLLIDQTMYQIPSEAAATEKSPQFARVCARNFTISGLVCTHDYGLRQSHCCWELVLWLLKSNWMVELSFPIPEPVAKNDLNGHVPPVIWLLPNLCTTQISVNISRPLQQNLQSTKPHHCMMQMLSVRLLAPTIQ